MKLGILSTLLLLSEVSAASIVRGATQEQTINQNDFGFKSGTGKSTVKFLVPSKKFSGELNGGIHARDPVSAEIAGYESSEGRELQKTAQVEVINNCGFNAFIGIYYSALGRKIWYSWPLLAAGGSVQLKDVDDPTIYIYGVKADTFTTVWNSPLSPHCFSDGDCLSPRYVGSLANGPIKYSICQAQPGHQPPTNNPTQAPTRKVVPSTTTTDVDKQWLQGHNTRRTQFFAKHGKGPLDLKWSQELKRSAKNYAEQLLQLGGSYSCEIEHGYNGDDYGGENLAAQWGYGSNIVPLSPDTVMKAWFDDEINLPYGQKGHATQMVFRSTHYVGCAGAQKTLSNGGYCFIQVCRYISPGNCNMNSRNWLTRTLDDTVVCDPACPPEGCF